MKNLEFSQNLHLKHGGTIEMLWEREGSDDILSAIITQGNMDGDVPSSFILQREEQERSAIFTTQIFRLTHEEARAVAEFILKDLERRL